VKEGWKEGCRKEAVPVLTLCVLFARAGTTLRFLTTFCHDQALVNQFVTETQFNSITGAFFFFLLI
jgi:hypothetical protein